LRNSFVSTAHATVKMSTSCSVRGSATTQRTGWVDGRDDPRPTPVDAVCVDGGDTSYHLDGRTLTILANDLEGTYES